MTSELETDEGLCPPNMLPVEALKKRYGLDLSPRTIDQITRSSGRVMRGDSTAGSAVVVSSRGLVLTNHHVVKNFLSVAGLVEFLEPGYNDKREVPIPGLSIETLVSIKRVTGSLNVGSSDVSVAQVAAERRSIIASLEQEVTNSRQRGHVIMLDGGAEWDLYLFERYDDVRLVFLPEWAVAFYGGDVDNFEYYRGNRYNLDFCVLRLYREDRPAETPYFLRAMPEPLREEEPVVVCGNPGNTSRSKTVSHLAAFREGSLGYVFELATSLLTAASAYAAKGKREMLAAKTGIESYGNEWKFYRSVLAALYDDRVITSFRRREEEMRARVRARPDIAHLDNAWDTITETLKVIPTCATSYWGLERDFALPRDLSEIARSLVRLAAEEAKPDGERLPEFRAGGRDALKSRLLRPLTMDREFEAYMTGTKIALAVSRLGMGHPVAQILLGGKSPHDRAKELIFGTRLDDVAVRAALFEGGAGAVASSDDSMVALWRDLDPLARRFRKMQEEEYIGPQEKAYGQINGARAALGMSGYPDATGSPRFSFGFIRGVEGENPAPPWNTVGGFARYVRERGGENPVDPWNLPASWATPDGDLPMAGLSPRTPFVFVTTADIVPGSSGSPVITFGPEGPQVVGLVFDHNAEAAQWSFEYNSAGGGRSMAVTTAILIQALSLIYHRRDLLAELAG